VDTGEARGEVEAGRMRPAMFDRLPTSERGVREMAARVREVAALSDPLGRVLGVNALDDDLTLTKVSCPLGVLGVVFESRPDVIPQVAALAFKSGNAALLKGGREAARTNAAIFNIWRDALANFPDVPAASINLLHSRGDVDEMLALDEDLALIIPRGSKEFVNSVAERSRVPVLGHGEGICHVYVDAAADLTMAVEVALDAKTQYPAACNAAETLLVHQAVAAKFLPPMLARFAAANVEVRADERARAFIPSADVAAASESDWSTEYSDLVIAVKVVDDLDEALAHIDAYGSRHTETIITEDAAAAQRFLAEVDAAGVYHNVSTRFADGYRYGLGAEVGISTSKLHARGPVGIEGLTTYKYQLTGAGHTVASYQKGERTFKHRHIL
ncbi:MAG TPA: glutamate-5-semialdehyde dehydrogenase, partial [Pyrinomonadaceae bacterium]|nr:glutamate-5-semialdehyde dehydrogenase [Pyrinomonadaceae bacterium]